CEHSPWRAFLAALGRSVLNQPGRYAAFFFKPIHNIWS
ncbi:MAG: metallophosphoesterase, partial [Solirubrobacterales bacterium]|nr:metallophosphoesterase [Solirubrobacterales bacterium]